MCLCSDEFKKQIQHSDRSKHSDEGKHKYSDNKYSQITGQNKKQM